MKKITVKSVAKTLLMANLFLVKEKRKRNLRNEFVKSALFVLMENSLECTESWERNYLKAKDIIQKRNKKLLKLMSK